MRRRPTCPLRRALARTAGRRTRRRRVRRRRRRPLRARRWHRRRSSGPSGSRRRSAARWQRWRRDRQRCLLSPCSPSARSGRDRATWPPRRRDAASGEEVEHRRCGGALVGGVAQHHGGEIEQHPVERGIEVVDVDDGNVGHVEHDRRGTAFEFVEHASCDLGGVVGGQYTLADIPAVAAMREWCGAAGERGSAGHTGFGGVATVGVERLDHQPVDGVRHEVALEPLGELFGREVLAASAEHLVDGGTPLLQRGRGELVGQARACRRIGHRLHRIDSTEADFQRPAPTPDATVRVVREGGLEPPRPFGHQHLKLARLPFRHSRKWITNVSARSHAWHARRRPPEAMSERTGCGQLAHRSGFWAGGDERTHRIRPVGSSLRRGGGRVGSSDGETTWWAQ